MEARSEGHGHAFLVFFIVDRIVTVIFVSMPASPAVAGTGQPSGHRVTGKSGPTGLGIVTVMGPI